MDLFALWIGRIVIGFATGAFVIAGMLILSDHYGRMLWKRLKAAQYLKEVNDGTGSRGQVEFFRRMKRKCKPSDPGYVQQGEK